MTAEVEAISAEQALQLLPGLCLDASVQSGICASSIWCSWPVHALQYCEVTQHDMLCYNTICH